MSSLLFGNLPKTLTNISFTNHILQKHKAISYAKINTTQTFETLNRNWDSCQDIKVFKSGQCRCCRK